MADAFRIAQSALGAMAAKLDVTANNVANAQTDGFKRSRTVNRTAPGGGVEAEVEQLDSPGPQVTDPATGQTRELSNVDLAEEMINLIEAERGFEANLKVIRAEDEMLGAIIDTLV